MISNAAKVIPVSNAAGGNGGGNDMETRVAKLETVVGTMQQDIAIIKATCATKSELADLKTELKADMHKLKEELTADMHKLKEELKEDIHGVKEQLKEVQVEFFKAIAAQTDKIASQTKWFATTIIATAVMIITVLPIILHFTK